MVKNRPLIKKVLNFVPLLLCILLVFGGVGLAKDSETTDTEKKDSSTIGMNNENSNEALMDHRSFVGREVRSATGNGIGEVENVILTENGKKVKALLSVGGFLGIGDKNVLVDMDQLQFKPKTNFVTYRGTEEDLEAMPEFDQPEARGYRYAQRRDDWYYGNYPYDSYGIDRYPYNRRYDRNFDRNRYMRNRYYDRNYENDRFRENRRRYHRKNYGDGYGYRGSDNRYYSSQDDYYQRDQYDNRDRRRGYYFQGRCECPDDRRYDNNRSDRDYNNN